jgi:cellulose 1,4-beta-cellobiosidase
VDLKLILPESNSHSFAITARPCWPSGYMYCEKDSCGDPSSDSRYPGICDRTGCGFNPYQMGAKEFYGKGKTLDTSKKFT